MKIVFLVLLLFVSLPVFAKNEFIAGQGLSEYKQFLLYPHVDKAYRLIEKGEYQQATVAWQDALNVSPGNIVVTEELVKTYIHMGQLEVAKTLLKKQVEIYGSNSKWLALKFQLAMDVMSDDEFEKLIHSEELSAQGRVTLIYEFSNYKFESGEKNSAVTLLLENLAIDNQALLLHRSYAYILFKMNRIDDVEKLLTLNTFEHDGVYSQISNQLLESYIAINNIDAALILFTKLDKQHLLTSEQKKQWAFLLESQGKDSQAEQLLQTVRSDFDAQLHVTSLNMDVESYATVMNQLLYTHRLISNSGQEKRYIELFAEIVNQRYQLAHHFYAYQVKFKNNNTFWLQRAINLASSKQSYVQLIKLLENEKHLTKVHKRLLADTYWLQGAKNLAIKKYQSLQRYYPLDTAITTQYIGYLVADSKNAAAINLLKANYPFETFSKSEQELLKNYSLQLLSELEKNELQAILLSKKAKITFTDEQKILAGNLWAKIGYCKKAQSIYPAPLQKQPLLTLAYCYQEIDSVYALDYFSRASALDSSNESTIILAYSYMQQRDMDSAFQQWEKAMLQEVDSKHYLPAGQAALAEQQYEQGETWLTVYESQQGEETSSYWDIKAQLALHKGNTSEALSAFNNAQLVAPSDNRLIEMAKLQTPDVAKKSYKQAEISLKKQYQATPNDSQLSIKIGNLLVMQGKPKEAIPYFEGSLKGQPDNYPMYQKISYLHLQAGNKVEARNWSEKATQNIDYYITEATDELSVDEQKFNQKSYNEQLHRDFNLNADYWNGKNSVPANLPITPRVDNDAQRYGNYWNIELLTAANSLLTPVGDFIFYGRIFGQDSDDTFISSPSGVDLAGVGVKYKPLASQGIYLIAEPQYAFDRKESELMLRISASFLADGEYSPQWHVQGNSWFEQELYFDAAYWLVSDDYSLLGKYTLGQNFKINSNLNSALTVKPYLLTQLSDNKLGFDSRVGTGIALQLWSGGSNTMSYKRKSSLEFQLDKAISTYLADDIGVSLTMRLAW